MTSVRVAVLTVSDRSARNERTDLSGPALRELAGELGWMVVHTAIAADEKDEIQKVLLSWSDHAGEVDIILTTGGTGFAPRDVTPEATLAVVDRIAPGLAEAMRQESMKITPHAMLSRAVCGIRGQTLIINLPGSPKAAVENLKILLPVLPHAVELLQDSSNAEDHHHLA